MPIVIIVFCLLAIYISYSTNRDIYNPSMLFCALWMIIVFLASLGLYNMSIGDIKAYLMIFIGIVFFEIGCFAVFIMDKNKKNPNFNYQLSEMKESLNWNIIIIMSIISIIILSNTAIKSINMLRNGYSLYQIRYMHQGQVFESGIINIMYSYFARPFTNLLAPISIVYFYIGREKKKKLFLFINVIMLMILTVVSSGERFILLDYLFYFLVVFLIFRGEKIKKSKKRKRKIISITILVGVVMGICIITSLRGSSILGNVYRYLCGCVPAFGIEVEWLKHINNYTYGLTYIKGFVRPILKILNSIGIISSMPNAFIISENLTNAIQDNVINIGTSGSYIPFNAYVSSFYYFYLDLGTIGVALFSCVYGMFCKSIYIVLKKRVTMKACIMYLLITQSIMASMFQFSFSSHVYALSFYYLLLVFWRGSRMKLVLNGSVFKVKY